MRSLKQPRVSIGGPDASNDNIAAFVESAEKFMRDAEADLMAAHAEAGRTNDFDALGRTPVLNYISALAPASAPEEPHEQQHRRQAAHQGPHQDAAAEALQGHPAQRRLHAARVRRAGAQGGVSHERGPGL